MAKVITLGMLIRKKACQNQVDLFKKYFGKSVEITEDICLKYYNEFEFDWLIDNMLNEERREAYKAIKEPAWEDYKAIQGPANEAYKVIQRSVYEAYKVIHGPAYIAYKAIQEPAYEAYNKEKARAFCVAYNS